MRISDWSSDVCSSDLFAGCEILVELRRKPDERRAEGQAEDIAAIQIDGDLAAVLHAQEVHVAEAVQLLPFGIDVGARIEAVGGADPGGADKDPLQRRPPCRGRSEEHTSELQSLMRISYAVFCLKQ